MTTTQQRRFYFPGWNAVKKLHGWGSLKGDALRAVKKFSWGPPEVDKIYRALWLVAEALADQRQDPGSLSAEDLRHACNYLASGKKTSSGDLTNSETNRVVKGLLGWIDYDRRGHPFIPGLLIDPDSLDAMNAWLHPEVAARAGTLAQIGTLAPEAYIVAVCRGKFSREDWENLNDRELNQLLFTLKARARSKAAASAKGGAASSGAACARREPGSGAPGGSRPTSQLVEEPF